MEYRQKEIELYLSGRGGFLANDGAEVTDPAVGGAHIALVAPHATISNTDFFEDRHNYRRVANSRNKEKKDCLLLRAYSLT